MSCGESAGDYSQTTLSKQSSYFSTILESIKTRPEVDPSRIGLLGQSLGTSVIVTLKPKVKSIVLMGATPHPKEALIKMFGQGYNPTGISTRIKSSGKITKIAPTFWNDFDSHDLLASIKEIHCPILFLHGEKDDKAPLSEMETYFTSANAPKQKIILKNADHGLNPEREKAYEIIVEWFKETLI